MASTQALLEPVTMTVAPSSWKRLAVAAPMPLVPPVISAILSFRAFMQVSCRYSVSYATKSIAAFPPCQEQSLTIATNMLLWGHGADSGIRLHDGSRTRNPCLLEERLRQHLPAQPAQEDADRRRLLLQHAQEQEKRLPGMFEALQRDRQSSSWRGVFCSAYRCVGGAGAV